jgi:hypothetical protein
MDETLYLKGGMVFLQFHQKSDWTVMINKNWEQHGKR